MKKTAMIKKRDALLKELNDLAPTILIGSLYETNVSCGIKTCKKCKDGKKGHLAHHSGYQTSLGNHKTTYVPKTLIQDVKDGQEKYKYTKKLLMDLAELNLLILKAKD